MLTEQELIHYSRHILLDEIDESGQLLLKESKVLVVGLGGLGSPVALYLAAAGVGTLYLADFDKVETSNLQRQVIHELESVGDLKVNSAEKTIKRINPWVNTILIDKKIDQEVLRQIISEIDLIVDCSDNFDTRFALNQASIKHNKPLVYGSAIRFDGQVSVFNYDKGSACYECFQEAGVNLNETCLDQGVLSPIVGTIGTLQATEALKILISMSPALDSVLLMYKGKDCDFKKITIPKDPSCKTCS